MTADPLENEMQQRRRDDSFVRKHVLPIAVTIGTSLVSGMASAYVTVQLLTYRITVLEHHERDDSVRFEKDDTRDHDQDIRIENHATRIGMLERTGGASIGQVKK